MKSFTSSKVKKNSSNPYSELIDEEKSKRMSMASTK